jgi:hypothetical protein
MIVTIVAALVVFAGGFATGRVKNAAKLAAVKSALEKYETSAVAEVKTLVADVKAKL